MQSSKDRALAQLDDVIAAFERLPKTSRGNSKVDWEDATGFSTRALATVLRIAGVGSAYAKGASEVLETYDRPSSKATYVLSILKNLRADVDAGYITSERELIHGEVFADFLEMAQHLLDEGYKDPAAVIAGSALEEHLRQLCHKHGIDVNDNGKAKKADRLNGDLKGKDAYQTLDHKNVTAWLDLRNKAAHGKYTEYEKGQVSLMIWGIRDFLTRTPA